MKHSTWFLVDGNIYDVYIMKLVVLCIIIIMVLFINNMKKERSKWKVKKSKGMLALSCLFLTWTTPNNKKNAEHFAQKEQCWTDIIG